MRKVLVSDEWEAFFHQWVNDSVPSVFAIVERLDGTVGIVDWQDLKFLTPPEILEQPVEVGRITKEELIEKWRNYQIAIENDDKEALVQALALIGVKKLPYGEWDFYVFCDDKLGWGFYDKTYLPTIKATEALEILTQPKTIKTK